MTVGESRPVRTIVVGYDGSAGAVQAMAWLAPVAAALHAEVVVVRGYDPLDELGRATPPVDFAALEAIAREALATDAAAPLGVLGVPHSAELVEGDPIAAIVGVVEARRADLVVVGSHGRTGWRERILGGVATRLPSAVGCPVVIVPQKPGS